MICSEETFCMDLLSICTPMIYSSKKYNARCGGKFISVFGKDADMHQKRHHQVDQRKGIIAPSSTMTTADNTYWIVTGTCNA